MSVSSVSKISQAKFENGKITKMVKQRKKVVTVPVDSKQPQKKYGGLSLEEVMLMTLPDRVATDLEILIIGINPSPQAAYRGHHYIGNNHMWACLHKSGLIDQPLTADDDECLPSKFKIGFTTMVKRTTPRQCDLADSEFCEGGHQLLSKLNQLQPKIAVFNGKKIYERFLKKVLEVKKPEFGFGRQPIVIGKTCIFVMPSTSALCATYPSALNKVPFFEDLKRWKDEILGRPDSSHPLSLS